MKLSPSTSTICVHARVSKGTSLCGKRGLFMCQSDVFYGKRGLFMCQKWPLYAEKEAYLCVKVTYLYGKRGLFMCQRCPIHMAKQADLCVKIALFMSSFTSTICVRAYALFIALSLSLSPSPSLLSTENLPPPGHGQGISCDTQGPSAFVPK